MRLWAAAAFLIVSWSAAAADPQASVTAAEEARAARTVQSFRKHVPQRFFSEAHGYAVLPSVKRVGLGLGGTWGRGIVFEQGAAIGRVRYWQLSSGIQTGARTVSMIVFFRDEEAMATFKLNRLRFMGQVGFALVGLEHMKTPAYSSGVAMFASSGYGFMVEASIAGGKLAWRPADR